MRRVFAGFVVLVLAGGGFWFWNSKQSTASSAQYLTATASRQTVSDTVAATGTVQPQATIDLTFGSSGGSSNGSSSASTVAAVGVTAGEHVPAGKVLATLTATNQNAAVASAQGQLTAAEAQVTSAKAQLASAEARRGSEPSVASQVAAAKAQLATAQAQLTVAQAQLAQAKAKLAGEPPGTPASQLASDQTAIAQAQAQVVQAQGSVATAQRGVTTAANGTATAASDAASVAQARLGVTQAENGVTTARSNLTTAQSAASATSLVAPTAGVVTAVNVSAGAVPPSGTAAISIRSDGLAVVASVAEQDVTKLKAGLAATVTFPALSTTAQATMEAMPTQANSSSGGGSSSVVTFPVTLGLANPPPGLLPGMSAQISLVIESSANVLAVPTTAIQGTTTAPTVQIMVNGAPQTRPVQIGLSTASETEIVAGLSAGDVVVTGVVNPLATVTTGGFGGGGGGVGGGLGGTGTRTGGGGFGRNGG